MDLVILVCTLFAELLIGVAWLEWDYAVYKRSTGIENSAWRPIEDEQGDDDATLYRLNPSALVK